MMDVIVRVVTLVRQQDEDGLMQVALVLKPCERKRKSVKYMLFTGDENLVAALQQLKDQKDPINLEALDILLTAAEWPTTMQ